MSHTEFADRLRKAMDDADLKQVDLVRIAADGGQKLGKSQLSQYLSGKTMPRQATLRFLAVTLNVSPDWLVGTDENNGANRPPRKTRPRRLLPRLQPPPRPWQMPPPRPSMRWRTFRNAPIIPRIRTLPHRRKARPCANLRSPRNSITSCTMSAAPLWTRRTAWRRRARTY